ncbi:hypothetical protein RchiOBHm_Chr5g0051271 [Rosa chinensis]|uniref:Uncharacterized protein n=1 Tax=Rosa chinensis TaxID=74649 RepID=A0A2P6QFB8_ROSCH|nr:hypothetical protein RchiOBHm_Chr5g0051271 [Rosa chinensis]
MGQRLSSVASKIIGGKGVVHIYVAFSHRLCIGMDLPVGKHIVLDKPLPINYELVWDNNTSFPPPCIDRITDTDEKCRGEEVGNVVVRVGGDKAVDDED